MRLEEVNLRNFRCFGSKQSARIAPLTLLVGENSTGKTSFLAAVREIWNFTSNPSGIDFRKAPFDLGAFPDIVYNESYAQSVSKSFEIGCRGKFGDRIEYFKDYSDGCSFQLDVVFRSRSTVPFPYEVTLKSNDLKIGFSVYKQTDMQISFGKGDRTWLVKREYALKHNRSSHSPLSNWLELLSWVPLFEYDKFCERLEPQNNDQTNPSKDAYDEWSELLEVFGLVKFSIPSARVPIRSKPNRTYDPVNPTPNLEGLDTPTNFAPTHYQGEHQWGKIKRHLEVFGQKSGLFQEINVKKLGNTENGPFQLAVKHKGRKNRNLIDVGFGVNQVLPIVAGLQGENVPELVLIQQPEVHLHPSAQAALGNLFCDYAATGNCLIAETHSDYIVDRVRILVRKKEFDHNKVSIIFFEPNDDEVTMHNMTLDKFGNLNGAPEGYRDFFLKETDCLLGFDD